MPGIRSERADASSSATLELTLTTQIFRFIATGAMSAVVDFGLYTLLVKVCGFDITVAKSLSFIAGTTTAYLINRRWTFKAEPSRARFLAVVVLYAVTFAVQVGLNTVLHQAFPDNLGYFTLAFVIAQAVATVINFIVQRTVIFRIS
ncbi:MAG: GtrA family protein [Mycobacteriaceae bacterium]